MMPTDSATAATAAAACVLLQKSQQVQCGSSAVSLHNNGPSPTASTANTSTPESPSTETGLGRSLDTSRNSDLLSSCHQHGYNRTGLDLRTSVLIPRPPTSNTTAPPSQQQFSAASTSPNLNTSSIDLRRQLCDQNVFVFHLPSEWTEDELKREFSHFGSILSCKVVKRPDGTSKGYGFVCFNERSSAFASVETMNGRQYGGKRLKVSLKKTPEECLHLQVQKLMEISNANQPYDRDRDCTLFVFHLPSSWDDKDVYQHFQSFGSLLSAKIAKKDESASRGYGFVTYDNPRAAALAIANMNGVEVGHNKRLKVQLKQQSNPPQPVPGCTIFIFHLPNDWTDNHLRQHFSHFGKIFGATVQRDSLGNSRGYGFVSFDRQHSALNAVIGMNGFSVGHKRLKVSLKRGDNRCAVVPSTQNTTRDIIQTQNSHLDYWDAAAQAAADFAVVHAAAQNQASRNQSSQIHAMHQAFAASRQPYSAAEAHRIQSYLINSTPNYPSTTTNPVTAASTEFSFHHPMSHSNHNSLASTTAAAYSNYFPHWNPPSDLGLGR